MNPEDSRDIQKEDALDMMKNRILNALGNPETRQKVGDDFQYTFKQIGLDPELAQQLRNQILELLESDQSLPAIEAEALQRFNTMTVTVGEKETTLVEAIEEKLHGRADLIFEQISPYLKDVRGKMIDYGAGEGWVTQRIHDRLGIDIEGVDPQEYHRPPEVTVPIKVFDGTRTDATDKAYEAATLTNVFHHERDNEKIFDELDRIVQHKLVVIETVPVGDSEEEMENDKDRTFMNDYLYNRLFHNENVPVPGTFETPQGWIQRFAAHGWKLTHAEDLGFDQPTIKDRHYLMTFERA